MAVQALAHGPAMLAAYSPGSVARGNGGYFVEFRAAEIGVYGHSYIAYGRLNRRGRRTEVHYADLHPEGGFSGLALGHVVPVAGSFEPEPETLTLPQPQCGSICASACRHRRREGGVPCLECGIL
jgi:hypothetical protein